MYSCNSGQPSVPELWSEEEEISEDLGSGLNILASGLNWALTGGAGGGFTVPVLF